MNIPRDVDDPHYRYKMPVLRAKARPCTPSRPLVLIPLFLVFPSPLRHGGPWWKHALASSSPPPFMSFLALFLGPFLPIFTFVFFSLPLCLIVE